MVLLATGSGTVLSRSIGANAAFDAPLTVPLGGTLEVRVLFLDEAAPADLDRAFPPHEDEGESLRVTVANGAIASRRSGSASRAGLRRRRRSGYLPPWPATGPMNASAPAAA